MSHPMGYLRREISDVRKAGSVGGLGNWSFVYPIDMKEARENDYGPNYAAVLEHETKKHFSLRMMNRGCYGSLFVEQGKYSGADYIIDYFNHKPSAKDEENTHEYIEFLTKDSLFSDCFISKDPKKILEEGCIRTTNFPAQYVLIPGKIIRNLIELTHYFKNWCFLKDFMSKTEALALAHILYDNGNKFSFQHTGGGHAGLSLKPFGRSGLKKFLKDDKSLFDKLPTMKENVNPRNMHRPWNDWVAAGWSDEPPKGDAILIPKGNGKPFVTEDAWGQPVMVNLQVDKTEKGVKKFLEDFKKINELE